MNIEHRSGIYCIENLITHKKYIGQSINLYNRWGKHISELNNGNHHNDYLQKAWNKYGQDSFTFTVLEYCNQEELDDKEQYYIALYDTTNRDSGYNLKQGGQFGGGVFTDEAKKRLSESIKASYTDELRRKRSEQQKEMWLIPEVRAKRVGKNAPMYGHHHTDETKKKVGDANRGKSRNIINTDKVLCVETGNIFDNSRVAYKETGVDSSCILKVCRGERKIAGGYHWRFVTENNNWENKVS